MLILSEGHRNLVRFVDAYVETSAICVVMERCEEDLYQRIEREPLGRMTETQALRATLHIARGLQFLHEHGIAHRDVSIENVLVIDNVYKLCDFGLSTSTTEACRAGDCVGKAYYMAPEVVAQQAPYDAACADLWSLGIVLFILLTGSPLVQLASSDTTDFRAFQVVGIAGVLKLWRMTHCFTPATLDLLSCLLQPEPCSRIASAGQALEHVALLNAARLEQDAP